MSTAVIDKPGSGTDVIEKTRDSDGNGLCGGNQVVIYNDNFNTFDYVVKCLMAVFKHPEPVAFRITNEAHH